MAYLLNMRNLEYKEYIDEKGNLREKKIILNKLDYVERLSKQPYAELSIRLTHLCKWSLADDMEREISFINERYNKEIKSINEVEGNVENSNSEDIFLSTIIETITKEIISINPEKYKKEREYQIGLKEALKVAVRKDFPKSKISVDIEYKTESGRKIDIMIQIDNYRIGVETKYNLSSSGNFQRVVGQCLEYSTFLDALMVVQYETLDNEIGLNNLKELKNKINIPLKVIANGNVKI